MKRHYYAKSGSFTNAMSILVFKTRSIRDKWVNDEPMSGTGSHYNKNRQAITRREAESQLASNNRMARDHRENSAHDECYGTTGRIDDLELIHTE